jgi:putative transposase
MTQYKITVNKNILHHLLSSNDEGMKELLKQILDQILEQQRTEQINAERYERTEERRGRRNGYKTRNLITRVGTITLRIPQIRDGVFSTDLFKRYQRSEQALVLALMEMVINGVSTRKVAAITEELCGTSFSASTVSALCKRLDPIVNGWNERPLSGSLFPFIIVDAIVIKIRENNRVCPHSALIAIGVNEDGYREILGMKIGNSETEESWSEFFTWLKGRGLRGVDFVASDNHGGLVNAVARCFQGATWQRCQTHFTRNILDNCPVCWRPFILTKYQDYNKRKTADEMKLAQKERS